MIALTENKTIETVCVGGPYNGYIMESHPDITKVSFPVAGGCPLLDGDEILAGTNIQDTSYELRQVTMDFELVQWVYLYWCHESLICTEGILGEFHLSDCYVKRSLKAMGRIVKTAELDTLFDYGLLRLSSN